MMVSRYREGFRDGDTDTYTFVAVVAVFEFDMARYKRAWELCCEIFAAVRSSPIRIYRDLSLTTSIFAFRMVEKTSIAFCPVSMSHS